MASRATDEGPTSGDRATRHDAVDAAQEAAEALARGSAMRDQATAPLVGSGPVRPKQQDPRAHIEAQAAARAATAADAALFAGQFASLTEGTMGDGAFDAVEDLDVEIASEKDETVPVRSQGPTVKSGPEYGGDPDPVTPQTTPPKDEPVEHHKRGPSIWPRVSPRRRIRDLDLEWLLREGESAGLLLGWQARTVVPRVLGLPSQWYHALAEALGAVDGDLARVVLLKALAAHRHPKDVALLVPRLDELGEGGIRAWGDGLEAERPARSQDEPGDAPSIDVLRRHYDPIASLLTEPPGPPRPDAVEEWPMPMWVRGARRVALELCAVAFHQAACDHLHPEWETSSGAGDPLMAALEVHFDAHPAIARWCTTLGARADDHAGLWAALEALRRARSSV